MQPLHKRKQLGMAFLAQVWHSARSRLKWEDHQKINSTQLAAEVVPAVWCTGKLGFEEGKVGCEIRVEEGIVDSVGYAARDWLEEERDGCVFDTWMRSISC